MPVDQTKVAAMLRDILELEDDVTDEEILELTKGSLTRAQVEFNVATRDVAIAFREAWPDPLATLRRMLGGR